MKERPILFSGPMVRAILDGRKTQTRRVVKPQPHAGWSLEKMGTITSPHPKRGKFGQFICQNAPMGKVWDLIPCPYGQPGDRLWVKETWKPDPAFGFSAKDKPTQIPEGTNILFRSTLPKDHPKAALQPWRPCLFMRRWMSRIALEIVSVRVERLNDCSEADAQAEGYDFAPTRCPDEYDPMTWYRDLWESINGPGSWAANPWVWVVEFRRITQ